MSKSLLQGDNRHCLVCGTTQNLHRHHIYFGAFRKASEKWGCWCWLCGIHHNMSNVGVHFNHDLDVTLKKACQRAFEEAYGHDKFMEIFRRNWL